MSWLYTILFAGLALSSQGSSSQNTAPAVQAVPVAIEAQTADETEKFDQTYPLNANGKVSLSNVNGSIVVEAWDRNEVKVEYTKTADSKDRLSEVEVKINSRPDSLSVETNYDNWKQNNGNERWHNGGKLQVDFHLTVPRGAVLNEIETVNGSVTVSKFTNFIKVSAVNGAVNATNLRGNVNLSTVNGEVVADLDKLETGSKIILSTVNGHVNLTIPSDSSATINADSVNGNISNDFGLPVRKGKYVGRDLYGRLGTGDVRIKLDSVNGALAIGRKNDGKALSPVTNMIQEKEKDDEDWDTNNDDLKNKTKDKEKSAKINRDIDRELRVSQRETERAMADAQRQIVRIQPEISKITTEAVTNAVAAADLTVKAIDSVDLNVKMNDLKIKEKVLANLANIDFRSSVPSIEKKSESFPVKGVPKVTVDAKGCSVKVQGWDKSEVQYRIIQFSDSRNRSPLNITENHSDSAVTIKVENPDGNAKSGNFLDEGVRVRIEIFVPRKSNLKISANGEVRLDGVSGDIDLAGGDESINVRDVSGNVHVASGDGRIRVVGFSGDMDARTNDGEVYLEGDFSKLSGKAADGKFILTVPEEPNLDIEANIEAITVENLGVPKQTSNNNWRFGKGGPKYRFALSGGDVIVRKADVASAM
ncbi:MAG TPA: hypothetical protein VHQ01_09120 [Pyrinomonadaceae bacterium]|nr:hypothetical protein [Pyrinomonadaceae bacterium]